MKKFGMPYQGSKSRIAEEIIGMLPAGGVFYDLFAGGCAMTHAAVTSKKWNKCVCNDINGMPFDFVKVIRGDFKSETRWISKEDFYKLKDSDPYVALCFSFGNNHLKSYAYSKEIEPFKKAVHFSIFYNDNNLLSKIINVNGINYADNNLHNRRIYLQQYFKKYIKEIRGYCNTDNDNPRNILQSLERLERLQSLESLQSLENKIEPCAVDYRAVDLSRTGVVYCDIPYFGTKGYQDNFNHADFWAWAEDISKIRPVFVSEITAPDNWEPVWQKDIKNLFSNKEQRETRREKLFTLKK